MKGGNEKCKSKRQERKRDAEGKMREENGLNEAEEREEKNGLEQNERPVREKGEIEEGEGKM